MSVCLLADITAQFGRLHAKLDHVEARLERTVGLVVRRVGTLMVVVTGVILAALRHWLPGHGG